MLRAFISRLDSASGESNGNKLGRSMMQEQEKSLNSLSIIEDELRLPCSTYEDFQNLNVKLEMSKLRLLLFLSIKVLTMKCDKYTSILVHHSVLIIIALTIFSIVSIILSVTLRPLPDFSDPKMGFQTRGTTIANRITAWKNLERATKPSGSLCVNPQEYLQTERLINLKKPRKESKSKKFNRSSGTGSVTNTLPKVQTFMTEETINKTRTEKNRWITLHKLAYGKDFKNFRSQQLLYEDYFCGSPDQGYAHVVWESKEKKDLFTLSVMQDICRLEYELVHTKQYEQVCMQTSENRCCRPWSLPNYIAQLHNRTSCLAIVEEDVQYMKRLLQLCSKYYYKIQLRSDCFEKGNCDASKECITNNAVFNILHYLTSTSFLPHKLSQVTLKQTMTFLPIPGSSAVLPYYHEVEKLNLEYNGIFAAAMEFGIKYTFFDERLVRDAWLLNLGAFFVFMCIWIYVKSLFLTIMTIVAITFSLGISYFVYSVVLSLSFFPFMNLLSVIIAVGIGADDAFVFFKMLSSARKDNDSSIIEVINNAFSHAFISTLITSVTTATAFSASYTSSITAVRCFSIFATTCVIVNCIFMMTWLPASIVIRENMDEQCTAITNWCSSLFPPYWIFCNNCLQYKHSSLFKLWSNREEIIINIIIRYRYYWVIILSMVTAASAVIVLYYPRLQLPSSPEFQLLRSTHPFEKYDLEYKNKFRFQQSEQGYDSDNANYKLPLRFVCGVLPIDNGNYLNPDSLGELLLDPNFDISLKEAQIWLLNFCRELRKQPFYQSTLGALLSNCFIEFFIKWMNRRCVDSIDKTNRTPCCEIEQFPYNPTVFKICIVSAMGDLFRTPLEFFIPGMAGPKFSKDRSPTIKAIVVEYDSNYTFSASFEHMNSFFTQVESWTNEQLKTAPASLKTCWFSSDLDFFDVEKILLFCTIESVCISMASSLSIVFLSTFNILLTFYAVLSITFSILTCGAILILMGWRLNILESIALIAAIGLTVDFSLHYIVHYRLYPNKANREERTRHALSTIIGPASMAALTTGTVGALMVPSTVLPYTQIGIFLVVVMTVSWIFSTFFLCSLLCIMGPENDFGQLQFFKLLRSIKNFSGNSTGRRDFSTSSSLSEAHELRCLTKEPTPFYNARKTIRRVRNKDIFRHHLTDPSTSGTSTISIILTDDN
ncbi:hypothetical protein FQA39_LY18285 [Lamprigera yunnana]|nr:hypothetical protein FQA39_LY18285 [Lamprigera yunnana]